MIFEVKTHFDYGSNLFILIYFLDEIRYTPVHFFVFFWTEYC